jgi:hypothetical protein
MPFLPRSRHRYKGIVHPFLRIYPAQGSPNSAPLFFLSRKGEKTFHERFDVS